MVRFSTILILVALGNLVVVSVAFPHDLQMAAVNGIVAVFVLYLAWRMILNAN